MPSHVRVDAEELKRVHPIADVVAGYGIDLRRSGRTFVGRCPFHTDRGRPNLYVYPQTASFYCFRCAVGGDVIRFIQVIEDVNFLEAVRRLGGAASANRTVRPPPKPHLLRPAKARTTYMGPIEQAVFAAAVDLYSKCLRSDPGARAYIQSRGLNHEVVERYRVGYCSGDMLVDYLRRRRLPLQAARRVGLLTRDNREFLSRRVVVPELVRGQPVWLVGRAFPDPLPADEDKYLGLPLRKPLLGWVESRYASVLWIVEGPFDWLTLRLWGIPAVALLGTHVPPDVLAALATCRTLVLCLDDDPAGWAGAAAIEAAVGARVVRCPPFQRAKDVNELAQRPDGHRRFIAHAASVDQILATAA
jgi:DNA primase